MSMSKKDYEMIADLLRSELEQIEQCQEGSYKDGQKFEATLIANRLSYALKAANPRFDRARFLKACGIGEGE